MILQAAKKAKAAAGRSVEVETREPHHTGQCSISPSCKRSYSDSLIKEAQIAAKKAKAAGRDLEDIEARHHTYVQLNPSFQENKLLTQDLHSEAQIASHFR